MNRIRKREPTHPGKILKKDYLEPLELDIATVAKILHVSRKTLSKVVNGRGAVTSEMALRLSRAFKTSPELWLNLQQTHDLWKAFNRSHQWKTVHAIAA